MQDGQVILSNFSLAGAQSTPDLDPLWNGTYTYTAPEYINGNPCAASDQYALATVVYEWLVGKPPFRGDRQSLINQHRSVLPSSIRTKRPEVPPDVALAVMRALAKEPEKRFFNVKDFAKALEEASSKSPKRRRKVRRDRRRATIAILTLLGIVTFTGYCIPL